MKKLLLLLLLSSCEFQVNNQNKEDNLNIKVTDYLSSLEEYNKYAIKYKYSTINHLDIELGNVYHVSCNEETIRLSNTKYLCHYFILLLFNFLF